MISNAYHKHNPKRLLKLARLSRLYLIVWLIYFVLVLVISSSSIVMAVSDPYRLMELNPDPSSSEITLAIQDHILAILQAAFFVVLAYVLPKVIYALLKLHRELQNRKQARQSA